MRRLLLAMAGLACTIHAGALVSISGDPANFFVPDQLATVDPLAQTVAGFVTLGDGSLGFNGGLATGPAGMLYGIANDSTGAGSLVTIQPDGTLSVIGAQDGLGFGFTGGLAWDPVDNTFLAVANDGSGNAFLYNISTGGAVSPGFQVGTNTSFDGLTYDTANQTLYGIGNDSGGNSTLYNIIPAGSMVTPMTSLGTGFGGITYDASLDAFWVISPVNNASSQLFQISNTGVLSSPVFTLGDGFVELAVASSATSPGPGPSAPEPGTFAAVTSGIAAIAAARRWTHNRGSK